MSRFDVLRAVAVILVFRAGGGASLLSVFVFWFSFGWFVVGVRSVPSVFCRFASLVSAGVSVSLASKKVVLDLLFPSRLSPRPCRWRPFRVARALHNINSLSGYLHPACFLVLCSHTRDARHIVLSWCDACLHRLTFASRTTGEHQSTRVQPTAGRACACEHITASLVYVVRGSSHIHRPLTEWIRCACFNLTPQLTLQHTLPPNERQTVVNEGVISSMVLSIHPHIHGDRPLFFLQNTAWQPKMDFFLRCTSVQKESMF